MPHNNTTMTFTQGLKEKVVIIEMTGFAIAILTDWLTELYDPPFSFQQVLIESLIALVIGWIVVRLTLKMLGRIRKLEGFMFMCASCGAIKVDGQWTPRETVLGHSQAPTMSHGICPTCRKKFQTDFKD